MPYAQTWSEELVAEWLQLKGYLVEVGVLAEIGKRGGRREADIVGARVKDGKLEIVHVEVGNWPIKFDALQKRIDKKFSCNVRSNIQNHFRTKLNFKGNAKPDYQRWLVSTYLSEKNKQEMRRSAKELGIKYYSLEEILTKEILNTRQLTEPRTPPSPLWLIHLVDAFVNSLIPDTRRRKKLEEYAKKDDKTILELIREELRKKK